MIGALVVFAATYVVIAGQRLPWMGLDRPGGAVVGAVAMVLFGGLSADKALAAIDLKVILLLLGGLVIAAHLRAGGFFRTAASFVLRRARTARGLLWGLTIISGALSALLVNDTVCIVLTPFVVAVAIEARLPVLPYLIALASATNVGGVVSFSGNPQNMIVGAAASGVLSYGRYFLIVLPAGLACLAANAAVVCWLFRKELPRGELESTSVQPPKLDRLLCGLALAALAAFAVMASAGVALERASMVAAAGLMVCASPVRPKATREALHNVDWPLLAFFAGLFVVVAGVAATGALERMFGAVDAGGDVGFVGVVVIGSNVVSNVPMVLVAVDWVHQLADPTWGYVMLAVASTLAGNLTLFGSVANIIVMEGSGEHGKKVGFWTFLRYGWAITLVDLVVAFGVLLVERVAGLF